MDNMMLITAVILVFGLVVKVFKGILGLAVKILICVLIAGFIIAKTI